MLTLRPYQEKAISLTMADLERHHSTGIIAPTGAGKTIMILEIVKEYLKLVGSGHNAIIVSHLSILQNQTMQGFIKHSKLKTSKLQGNEKPHPLTRVIISTMQTLRNDVNAAYINNRLIHNDTSIIMIDEAQMYGAASYKKIEQLFPNAKIVGLSASPYRGNKYSFNLFDTVSYSISLQELIDQGFLTPPNLHQVKLTGASIQDRISSIIGLIKSTIEVNPSHTLGRGSLVYWNTKDIAKLAASSFSMAGIPSAYMTDKTSAKRRAKVLEEFESGEIQVIHNVNILSAGYDSNKVFNIFLPMGTNSPVNYIQRIGRGLRLHPDKKECNIYCYGDPPTINKNIYERIHRISLKVSDDPDHGKRGDIYDKYEWMELNRETYSTDKINYVKECISICEQMKSINAFNLYKLIRFQKFPKKFLRSLITHKAKIDLEERSKATDTQKQWLMSKGLSENHINYINKGEAAMLINAIQNTMSKKWTVKIGLHMNKPIDEVPMAYIGALIRQKKYNHPVIKLYNEWKERGKPEIA